MTQPEEIQQHYEVRCPVCQSYYGEAVRSGVIAGERFRLTSRGKCINKHCRVWFRILFTERGVMTSRSCKGESLTG